MRPVRRGASPQTQDFQPYDKAKPYLISRLGSYCSYCERRIPTLLAVEHIQPKNLPQYKHLIGAWHNFLLSCTNCNSSKLNQDVVLAAFLLPDRDNTFAAFDYLPDGSIHPSARCNTPELRIMAEQTLSLTGLDKNPTQVTDENGKLIAIERRSQRMQAWMCAEESRSDLDVVEKAQGQHLVLRQQIIKTALASGFFSIWMTVFRADQDMRNRLIDAFAGTRESGCFDAHGLLHLPAPNLDALADGAKI